MKKLSGLSARDSVVAKNVLGSAAIRGASLVVALLTVPAYMRFFDDQQVLGLWFTIVSTLTWILNFDIGIGNGLRNRLVEALAAESPGRIRGYLASTYLATLGISAILGVVLWIVLPAVDWNSLFNVSQQEVPAGVLRTTVAFVMSGLLIQLVLRTVVAVLFALQKAAATGLFSLGTSIILLVYVLVAEQGGEAGLVTLAAVYAVAANVPLVLATILVFSTSMRSYRPELRDFRVSYAQDVLRLGGAFFGVQVAYMLLANTNSFLIALLSEPQHVVDFQIYSRPFMVVSSLFSLALAPLWSAVTQAAAVGDAEWIRKLFHRLVRAGVLVSCVLLMFVPLLQTFVDLWLGDLSIRIDVVHAMVFAASASAFAWSGALSSIVNGLGKLRVQGICFAFGLALKLVVAVVMTRVTGSWIWVIASDVIALLPYLMIQPVLLRRSIADN